MRHYKNKLSGKYLHQLKQLPKFMPRVMVVGQILGHDDELWCLQCVVRYDKLAQKYKP